jgi:hypothetical protein
MFTADKLENTSKKNTITPLNSVLLIHIFKNLHFKFWNNFRYTENFKDSSYIPFTNVNVFYNCGIICPNKETNINALTKLHPLFGFH